MIPSTPRPRRFLRILLLSLASLLVLLAILVALALWPPARHTQSISDEALLQAAWSFERKFEAILDARISDLKVNISLTDDEVNGYCAALQRDDLWTQLPIQDESQRSRWRPAALSNVRVSFRGSEAWLTGSLNASPVPLVLTVCVRPQIRPDSTITFSVTAVRLGHLPIPRLLARKWIGPLADATFSQHSSWSVKHLGITGGSLYLWAGPSVPHSAD